MPEFAIIGTGRCGTGWLAGALREAGIACGHERWWTLEPSRRVAGLDGDASWLAVPDIESGAWLGSALHVVRHPLDVARALLGTRFFSRPSPYLAFAQGHEPELIGCPPLVAVAHWWLRWNSRCAAVAEVTVQIEHIADLAGDVSRAIGRAVPARALQRPRRPSYRPHADVDATELWRLLDGRAESFGYRP